MEELTTNGRFNGSTTGWTIYAGTGSWSWSAQYGGSGRIIESTASGTTQVAQQITPPVAGRARLMVSFVPDSDALKLSVGGGYVKVDIRVVSTGDLLYQSEQYYKPEDGDVEHQQVYAFFNAPAEAIQIRLELTSTAAGSKVVYFDQVSLSLADYTVWTKELTTRLPGASTDQIDLELKATLREFFTKSGFWVEELAPIDIEADKDTYLLTYTGHLFDFDGFAEHAINQGEIMGIEGVWIDNIPYPLLVMEPKSDPTSSTRGVFPITPNRIKVFPTPSVDISGGMKVRVRLNPSRDFYDLPPETSSHFFDEIMDGVLGRLYSQPGKPYTNIVVSQYHLRRFRDGIARARDMGQKRYSNAEAPWSFPFFA